MQFAVFTSSETNAAMVCHIRRISLIAQDSSGSPAPSVASIQCRPAMALCSCWAQRTPCATMLCTVSMVRPRPL